MLAVSHYDLPTTILLINSIKTTRIPVLRLKHNCFEETCVATKENKFLV